MDFFKFLFDPVLSFDYTSYSDISKINYSSEDICVIVKKSLIDNLSELKLTPSGFICSGVCKLSYVSVQNSMSISEYVLNSQDDGKELQELVDVIFDAIWNPFKDKDLINTSCRVFYDNFDQLTEGKIWGKIKVEKFEEYFKMV